MGYTQTKLQRKKYSLALTFFASLRYLIIQHKRNHDESKAFNVFTFNFVAISCVKFVFEYHRSMRKSSIYCYG